MPANLVISVECVVIQHLCLQHLQKHGQANTTGMQQLWTQRSMPNSSQLLANAAVSHEQAMQAFGCLSCGHAGLSFLAPPPHLRLRVVHNQAELLLPRWVLGVVHHLKDSLEGWVGWGEMRWGMQERGQPCISLTNDYMHDRSCSDTGERHAPSSRIVGALLAVPAS